MDFVVWDDLDPRPPGFEPGPLDLTGSTVTLYVKDSPDASSTLLFSATCALDAPVSGKCSVRLTTAQTNLAGMYVAELRVVYTSGPRNGQDLWAGTWQMPVYETLRPSP